MISYSFSLCFNIFVFTIFLYLLFMRVMENTERSRVWSLFSDNTAPVWTANKTQQQFEQFRLQRLLFCYYYYKFHHIYLLLTIYKDFGNMECRYIKYNLKMKLIVLCPIFCQIKVDYLKKNIKHIDNFSELIDRRQYAISTNHV